MVDAQAHDLIPPFQSAPSIEATVHHGAAVDELGARGKDRFSHGVRILHPSLELELFAHDGHENSACSTAWVSPRSAKTCVAPAARSAGTS